LSEDLIKSVEEIATSRKRSGIGQLEYIISVLKQGSPIFLNVKNKGILMAGEISDSSTRSEGRLDLHRMDRQERILRVLERFTNEFEALALPLNVTIKEYVLFLVVCLKLARKLKEGQQKSLIIAQTLAKVNKMFVSHPIQHGKRTINDPLELLFLVTELTIEASKSLESSYELDDITKSQFVTLMEKYCTDSDNPLLDLVKDMSDIPKFRLNIIVGPEHQNLVGDILRYCFPKIPLKIRIDTVRKLLGKIASGENDAAVLTHYNTMKLMLSGDDDLVGEMSKLANQEIAKTRHNRFVGGILDELAATGKKS
jgi:hypothetical protein